MKDLIYKNDVMDVLNQLEDALENGELSFIGEAKAMIRSLPVYNPEEDFINGFIRGFNEGLHHEVHFTD